VPRTAWRRTAAVLALALVPVLSACSIGVHAGTTMQGPSGNGASAGVGAMELRGITIVTADGDTTKATVIGTIVNTSPTDDDVLTGVSVVDPTGATATITGTSAGAGQIAVPANRPTSSVRIGYNADYDVDITGLTIAPTAFAQVQFTFQNAGTVVVPTMVVPPTGIYAGLGPTVG
jgi:hypothetical protein